MTVRDGADTVLFPWAGSRVTQTLAAQLTAAGLEASDDGLVITVLKAEPGQVRERLKALVPCSARSTRMSSVIFCEGCVVEVDVIHRMSAADHAGPRFISPDVDAAVQCPRLAQAGGAAVVAVAAWPASASRRAASLVSSKDVRITVPPTPFRSARTLSVVIFRTSKNNPAVPGCSAPAASFIKSSLMPTSVNFPPATPRRLHDPHAEQWIEKYQADQGAPERGRKLRRWRSCLSVD